nr:S-layer homology domain-containing protein [uncultured Oscillibacter sp.]
MNNFWKRQVPAFLLTLVMLASLAPAALAETEWKSDEDYHWEEDDEEGKAKHVWYPWATNTEPTCGKSGLRSRYCKVCRYVEEEPIPATGAHSYRTESNKNGILTRVCAVCGDVVTESSTTTAQKQNFTIPVSSAGGALVGTEIRDKVAAFFKTITGESRFEEIEFKSISGSGELYYNSKGSRLDSVYEYGELSGYIYFIPKSSKDLSVTYAAEDRHGNTISGTITLSGALADSAEIVLRVAPGSSVYLKTARFEEAFKKLRGVNDVLETVEFIVDSDYEDFNGELCRGNSSLKRADLNYYDFYIDDDREGDYALDTLNFRADSRAKVGAALTMTVRYYGRSTSYAEGTLRVVIDRDGKQDGEVVYRVAPGGSVTFNRSDFDQAYRDVTGTKNEIRYVEFDPGDSYTNFTGKLSVSGHSDFTKRELAREWFYYSDSRRDSYVIDDLVFRAAGGAKDGDYLEIPFWACRDEDDKVKCTLRIVIDKNGSQDTVTLNVAPGGTARLDKTAFNKVYQYLSGYSSRTITAVSFYAPDSYDHFDGVFYVGNARLRLDDLTHDETWFYYSSSDAGRDDDLLEDVTFEADRDARENASLVIPFRAYYRNRDDYEEGTLRVVVTSEANTITYEAAPGGSVSFTASEFNRAYQSMSGTSRTIKYVAFEAGSEYASFAGKLYTGNVPLTRSDLTYTKTQFYNGTPNYGTYSIGSLYFRPDASAKDGSYLTMPFRAYYDSGDYEQGTLKLVVGAGGDISYTVSPGKTVNFDRTKFDDFFRGTYSSSSLEYVIFDVPGSAELPDSSGTLYTGYNTSYSTSFSRNSLRDVRFYYNANDAGRNDYALNDLTFAAASSFTSGKVTLRFTAYGTNGREVEGSVVIIPATASVTSNLAGNVRYAVTTGTNVQINANDLARFYKSAYPAGALQYVVLNDVPAAGGLYYNYYGASQYGASSREQITASNRSRNFYVSPASQSEYALTELTYVPSGSNYCAAIPFTAYGTNGQSVTGGILISVTNKAVSEVYGPTPRNTAVTFPASSIAAAVAAATGTTPSGVQLLKLPAANVGAVYVGNSTTPANTSSVYGYNTGSEQLGQLRFVPQTNYTGPVEIPYVALNASNVPIASGMFSMGVLNTNKKFGDINAATWCYKYVTELADSAVIDGYADGNFRPDSTITYGAALKLIMKAAGYPDQAPTVPGSTFSGYLAKAQADGLVTRSTVALNGPITRLQVAQLAAGALRLDINNLSSVKPFTDTADVYVQALNAAGIVEGYFNNGTSTFRPSNTLTRGQVSAIVWRMQNYRK